MRVSTKETVTAESHGFQCVIESGGPDGTTIKVGSMGIGLRQDGMGGTSTLRLTLKSFFDLREALSDFEGLLAR